MCGPGEREWGREETERRVGEEDMDGKACVVVGVECRDDEGELDSRDGTGAGEEEVTFVISVREGTEGCGGGGGDEIGGGGGHCCAAVRGWFQSAKIG